MCNPKAHCRLCAEPSPRLVCVDDEVGVNCELKQKMLLVNVDVSAPSPLPRAVCYSCLCLLEKTATFLHQVNAAQDKLLQIYQDNKDVSERTDYSAVDFDFAVKKEPQDDEEVEIEIEPIRDELPEEEGSTELIDIAEDQKKERPIEESMLNNKAQKLQIYQEINASNEHSGKQEDVDVGTVIVKEEPRDDVVSITIEFNCDELPKDKKPVSTEPLDIVMEKKKSLAVNSQLKNESTQNNINKDLSEHWKGKNKKKYLCECGKAWQSPAHLKRHQKIHSERTRDYHCDVCGKSFLDNAALQAHMFVHKTKQFKCDVCGLCFLFASKLKSHATMHTSERPFACDKCDKKFRQKRLLISHSAIHSDLMPYVCNYCDKAFRSKNTLRIHLRLHTGFRPVCCEHCGRDFYDHSSHHRHVRTAHGADPRKKKDTK